MSRGYGSKELIRCLQALGFYSKDSTDKRHPKFYHKEGKVGKYPFMIVQTGQKTFGKNASERYIQELKKFGFTKREIEDKL